MIEVKVKEAILVKAADESMDAFLGVFIDAINSAIGGQLTAENMSELTADQVTLLAWSIMHDELMDGGFVQLIHNGYGPFVFKNPFAKALKIWGLRDLAKLIYEAHSLWVKYGADIERDCSDDEFMAMFERFPEFDDLDDTFVENEELWTEEIAQYVDGHLDNFAIIEK